MRRTNWRLVIVGVALMVLAPAFLVFMRSMASRSNDPAARMSTVGTVSGAAGGISVAMIMFEFIGRNPWGGISCAQF